MITQILATKKNSLCQCQTCNMSQNFQAESLASCLTTKQRCTSHRHQVALVTQLCTVAPMGLQHKLLCVTLLVPGILKWLLDVWKICVPLPPPITKTVITPKLSNNALNNRKILSSALWYHVVWYTGKDKKVKVKQSCYWPVVAQWVPGS